MEAITYADGYKVDHRRQYPEGTTLVYSNLTARSSRVKGANGVIFYGLSYFIEKYLIEEFNKFFDNTDAVEYYRDTIEPYIFMGVTSAQKMNYDHIKELWNLGYLPIRIKALPEGSFVPLQTPMLTIENTHPDFAWVTNYIETLLSCTIWGAITSATTAYQYRVNVEKYTKLTGYTEMNDYLCHDFSFRGMFGLEAAQLSGSAHLLSHKGSDTIPAINFLKKYYAGSGVNAIACTIPATEHSCQCAGGKDDEALTYKRLITDVYPDGPVAIVSDTWDFWNVVTNIIPSLKETILNRNGKVVIRPDSGDPVKIIVGDADALEGSPEHKGLIECLWETFGGTLTETGHRLLDSHIGAIYGDSITLDRQVAIYEGLAAKGFACANVVLGIGSYTYQFVTRDTYGMAVKATYCEVNGESRDIFKTPKTDSGKKSHRGLIKIVLDDNGDYRPVFPVSRQEEEETLMILAFEDGSTGGDLLPYANDLGRIRTRIQNNISKNKI